MSCLNELLSSCCLKNIEKGTHYKTKDKLSELFASLEGKLIPPHIPKNALDCP